MKRKIQLIALLLFAIPSTKAQVLYDEDFENYSLGNLGTDPTGVTSGQGGWLTATASLNPNVTNSNFTITNEPNRGKVLTLSAPVSTPASGSFSYVTKPGIDTFINQRTPGNDVIKFEVDYYTGSQYYLPGSDGSSAKTRISLLYNNMNNTLFAYNNHLHHYNPIISASSYTGSGPNNTINLGNNMYNQLPVDTWVTFIVYMDYNNKKVYFETPYFNKIASGDFLDQSTSTNLIEDFKPIEIHFQTYANTLSNVQQITHKYDNIKITALNAVPPYVLNAENFLAQKFNLYPNPATNIVNITNNENMAVQQIMVYDVAGKQLSTQTFNNETEIQLNVENLASGVYMLHIQTNEGTAVKKVVKK